MTCTACSRRIEKNLNKVEGVQAYVDFATETAHVTMSPAVTREQLVKVVRDAGYDVSSKRSESEQIVWRLLVGGAISLPLAVISMVPGLMPMQWPVIAAILSTPVALWVAWPFHSAAIKNLRHRTTTMDTLVSLGVLIAYLYSVWQLVIGGMETYFEVAAVVPTVVLFGRWLEVRTRRSATDSVRALLAAVPETATVRRDGIQVEIPTNAVKLGDTVVLVSGQKMPVDGVVLEGTAQIDNALITGESVPEAAMAGTHVAAGAINLSGFLELEATAISANSRIAQIANLVREASSQKAKITSLTDRISSIFVPAVIGIAALTYVTWLVVTRQPQHALSAAIAVLVIACPCALGIAVPMSLAVATSMGARRGVIIRHPDTLSLLRNVRTIALDKTGTLTNGQLAVTAKISVAGATTDEATAMSYAAAVERGSVHPVAKAIAALDETLSAADVAETAGAGVAGIVNGLRVEVSRREAESFANPREAREAIGAAGAATLAIVSVNSEAVLVLGLQDQLRAESKQAVKALADADIKTVLLSGDRESRVAAVAAELGMDQYFAQVTPEGKLEAIQQLKAEGNGQTPSPHPALVAMVGDGLNDVAALAAADVGIAMGSGTHASQSAAGITILDDDPRAIPYAINLGRATYRNIQQNLGWAFGYNVILIPVAALGLLNPMLAGTAMAFSSISVVLNALRLRRAAK